jgi:ribonuclease E
VLGELVAAEDIEVGEDDIEGRIDEVVAQLSGFQPQEEEQQTALRGLVDTPEGRDSMRNELVTKLAVTRLAEICSQDEDEEAGESGSRRRTSRRRRGRGADDGEADADAPSAEDDAEAPEATADDESDGGSESGDDGDEEQDQA